MMGAWLLPGFCFIAFSAAEGNGEEWAGEGPSLAFGGWPLFALRFLT